MVTDIIISEKLDNKYYCIVRLANYCILIS